MIQVIFDNMNIASNQIVIAPTPRPVQQQETLAIEYPGYQDNIEYSFESDCTSDSDCD